MKKLTLKTFVKHHIAPNSLIRLLYINKNEQSEELIEVEISKYYKSSEIENCNYKNNKVEYVKSISWVDSRYPEAINIVIRIKTSQINEILSRHRVS